MEGPDRRARSPRGGLSRRASEPSRSRAPGPVGNAPSRAQRGPARYGKGRTYAASAGDEGDRAARNAKPPSGTGEHGGKADPAWARSPSLGVREGRHGSRVQEAGKGANGGGAVRAHRGRRDVVPPAPGAGAAAPGSGRGGPDRRPSGASAGVSCRRAVCSPQRKGAAVPRGGA